MRFSMTEENVRKIREPVGEPTLVHQRIDMQCTRSSPSHDCAVERDGH